MTASIHLEKSDGIAVLRLDNPAKWNCFTTDMIAQMGAHLGELERDPSLRAVLIASTGEKAFCSGADIKAWGKLSPAEFARFWVVDGHKLFDRIAQLFVPTIAVVQGHAFGGGLELAAACDLRVMAPTAQLALPEAGIGIVPGWSGTQRLARLLPAPLLKEMAFFGRKISAERAWQTGFVAELSDNPEETALAMAKEVLALSPRSVEINKRALNAQLGEGTGLMIEALAGAAASATADNREGVASFLEKRNAKFSGE